MTYDLTLDQLTTLLDILEKNDSKWNFDSKKNTHIRLKDSKGLKIRFNPDELKTSVKARKLVENKLKEMFP